MLKYSFVHMIQYQIFFVKLTNDIKSDMKDILKILIGKMHMAFIREISDTMVKKA